MAQSRGVIGCTEFKNDHCNVVKFTHFSADCDLFANFQIIFKFLNPVIFYPERYFPICCCSQFALVNFGENSKISYLNLQPFWDLTNQHFQEQEKEAYVFWNSKIYSKTVWSKWVIEYEVEWTATTENKNIPFTIKIYCFCGKIWKLDSAVNKIYEVGMFNYP